MTISIIVGILAFLIGGSIAFFVGRKSLQTKSSNILKDAEAEAEMIKKDKILQAKEKFLQLKAEHERVINEKNSKILMAENRINQRESGLSQKIEENQRKNKEIDAIRANLTQQIEILNKKNEELDSTHKLAVEKLETISGLSAEEAKTQIIESLKADAKSEAMGYVSEIIEEAKMNASKEARKIVINTIQRVATEEAIENSVTIFNIDNDDIKGRIIGREGRNIRALEAATGVEIIVDDTPEAIILSAFDPVRREIARLHFISW
jgi:ribonuclease Y